MRKIFSAYLEKRSELEAARGERESCKEMREKWELGEIGEWMSDLLSFINVEDFEAVKWNEMQMKWNEMQMRLKFMSISFIISFKILKNLRGFF